MQTIINKIINQNKDIFGTNPNIEKINVGFTNTTYSINNKYIVKVCTNLNNEDNFKKEIEFYKLNKENKLIPKLYYSSIDKTHISYLYEILEKIEGVTVYSIWHKLTEEEREDIIKQLCLAMKSFHSITSKPYNWIESLSIEFLTLYNKSKKLNLFSINEQKLINDAYNKFKIYLDSNDFVLIHNDLHFDNIFIHNGKIKIIDFERTIYAPKDFELDILFRMVRKPWKFASEETEKYTKIEDYKNIMIYIEKYYPELINTKNIYKRLAIYDIIYYLRQLVKNPNIKELKEDILNAVKIVLNQ